MARAERKRRLRRAHSGARTPSASARDLSNLLKGIKLVIIVGTIGALFDDTLPRAWLSPRARTPEDHGRHVRHHLGDGARRPARAGRPARLVRPRRFDARARLGSIRRVARSRCATRTPRTRAWQTRTRTRSRPLRSVSRASPRETALDRRASRPATRTRPRRAWCRRLRSGRSRRGTNRSRPSGPSRPPARSAARARASRTEPATNPRTTWPRRRGRGRTEERDTDMAEASDFPGRKRSSSFETTARETSGNGRHAAREKAHAFGAELDLSDLASTLRRAPGEAAMALRLTSSLLARARVAPRRDATRALASVAPSATRTRGVSARPASTPGGGGGSPARRHVRARGSRGASSETAASSPRLVAPPWKEEVLDSHAALGDVCFVLCAPQGPQNCGAVARVTQSRGADSRAGSQLSASGIGRMRASRPKRGLST